MRVAGKESEGEERRRREERERERESRAPENWRIGLVSWVIFRKTKATRRDIIEVVVVVVVVDVRERKEERATEEGKQ